MAGTTIWKGALHFGATHLPVKLHAAVKEERIAFHLLHERDRVKLQQQMICTHEQVAVPAEAQARGFEVEAGKFIIVAPEEMEQVNPESSRLIEIHEFVRRAEIDPIYFERTYYLEADTPPGIYDELAAALEELAVAGICTWTMRKRSYLGMLQTSGKMLRLTTLRHADEVVGVSALGLETVPLSARELQIGADLILQMTAPFRPEQFANEHEQKLQVLLDKKARGEKVVLLRPKTLKPTAADDLLHTLEASLRKVA